MRFVGDNYHNNAVGVDVKTGTVSFRPVVGSQNIFKYYVRFTFSSMFFSALIGMYYSILLFAAMLLFGKNSKDILPIIILSSVLCGVIYSLRYLSPRWRSEEYPSEQSRLSDAVSFALSFRSSKTLRVFDHASLIENKAFIPSFTNVSLEYKATGDMGRMLDRIDVINPFKDDAFAWLAVFRFNGTPKSGKLTVVYQ